MTHPAPLLLASESPYRRELLGRLRIPFDSAPHALDERSLEGDGLAPKALTERLARGKARSLRDRFPRHHIIGSDQVATIGGRILHKPGTEERARAQLQSLSGLEHQLITAVAIDAADGNLLEVVVEHNLRMRVLDADEINAYVAADQPLDCCGSYKIESLGISLFEAIDGADFTAIMGLPLMALSQMLRQLGYRVP